MEVEGCGHSDHHERGRRLGESKTKERYIVALGILALVFFTWAQVFNLSTTHVEPSRTFLLILTLGMYIGIPVMTINAMVNQRRKENRLSPTLERAWKPILMFLTIALAVLLIAAFSLAIEFLLAH